MKEPSKVAIIGNGASLIGRGLGGIIDSYEEVVRFNEFKTHGYEADVGNKTTIWFNNRDTDHQSIRTKLFQHRPSRMYVHEWFIPETTPLLLQTSVELSGTGTQAKRVKQHLLADMTAFLGVAYKGWSSGAIATWLMLQETESVVLAGFDWWHQPAKFHYMDQQQFDHSSESGHQPKIEKLFFDRLAGTGRLHFMHE